MTSQTLTGRERERKGAGSGGDHLKAPVIQDLLRLAYASERVRACVCVRVQGLGSDSSVFLLLYSAFACHGEQSDRP